MKKYILCSIIFLALAVPSLAGESRTYAEVVDGKVRAFHTRTDGKVPVFHPAAGITVVDVTGLNPKPKQKWKYNRHSKKFSLPDPPDPKIAQRELVERRLRSKRAEAIAELKAEGKIPANYKEQ